MGQRVTIDTLSGKLQGSFLRSSLGYEYYGFKGIPYAKPPVGPLRFEDPEPIEKWTGIRDATTHGSVCIQFDEQTGKVIGSEDCLYLNVYTRNLSGRLPVMVWIHGGAFCKGSGNDDHFGPDYFLMSNEVILVTINYRLSMFGFLNLEDEVAPGNQGMKDQMLALQWVNMNIMNFGGDPDNVTIFGGSAGAASVHLLTLSPLSRGLFHKAICQSGNAINIWLQYHEPRKCAYQLLDILGFKNRNPKAIVDFLRTVDAHKLVEAHKKMATSQSLIEMVFHFIPGVDSKSKCPFLPIPPSVAAEEGVQVPLMIGYNSLEGLMIATAYKSINKNDINRNFEKYLHPNISTMLEYYNLTTKDLRQLYFNKEEISENNRQKFYELSGDIGFVEGVHKLVKIQFHNSAAPTYLYKFSFDNEKSLRRLSIESSLKGVTHGEELNYLFKNTQYEKLNLVQLDESVGADRIMRQMIELWTNFAKIGRPTPATSELIPLYWQPLASDVILRYLNIDEELRMEKVLNIEQRYSFKKNTRHIY